MVFILIAFIQCQTSEGKEKAKKDIKTGKNASILFIDYPTSEGKEEAKKDIKTGKNVSILFIGYPSPHMSYCSKVLRKKYGIGYGSMGCMANDKLELWVKDYNKVVFAHIERTCGWNNFNATYEEAKKEFYENQKLMEQKCLEASNANTSITRLNQLAADQEEKVRRRVVENPNISSVTIDILILNSEGMIEKYAAEHPNASTEKLKIWAKSDNRFLRSGVASNPNTSRELLVELSYDENTLVRNMVGRNPNTPRKVLIRLAKHEDKWTRGAVAENPVVSKDLLEKLLNDHETHVSSKARVQYNERFKQK